jgi:uncharacterized protein YndB with AHSA1/START domain
MANPKTIVTKPSDREVAVARTFDAKAQHVFDAYTKPELVKRWLYGPEDWPMVVCEIDLRIGGKYRYVWRHREQGDMGMGGVYREVVAPRSLTNTELFDQDWTGGETLVTTVFEERDGKTTVTATVLYSSMEARDGALKTGMIEGWSQGMDRLDGLLATVA